MNNKQRTGQDWWGRAFSRFDSWWKWPTTGSPEPPQGSTGRTSAALAHQSKPSATPATEPPSAPSRNSKNTLPMPKPKDVGKRTPHPEPCNCECRRCGKGVDSHCGGKYCGVVRQAGNSKTQQQAGRSRYPSPRTRGTSTATPGAPTGGGKPYAWPVPGGARATAP